MNKVSPFFSIIIPAYNAEGVLPTMLDSIIAQSYVDFEVIIIDDCSSDGTVKIIKKYCQRDIRIRYLQRERNGGVSLARNDGIKMANGKYTLFWDADDWVNPICLETFHEYLSGERVDCVIAGTIEEYEGYRKELIPKFQIVQGKEALVPALIELEKKALVGYCSSKVFKTEIIKRYKIQFKKMPMNEDFEFTIEFLDYVNKVVIIDKAFYHYRLEQSDSLTKQYVKSFFGIHRKKISDFISYIDRNNPAYFEIAVETLRPIYLRYILSSVARTFSKNSEFDNNSRHKYVENIFNDDLLEKLSGKRHKVKINSEILYWPIIKRKTNLTIVYARVVVFIQSNMSYLFNRIKQIR